MMLDNLFSMAFGVVGTSAALLGILAFVGVPALESVVGSSEFFRRLLPRGR